MKPINKTVIDLIEDWRFTAFSDLIFERLTVEPIPEPQDYRDDVHWFNARIRSNSYHEQRSKTQDNKGD